MLLLTQGSGQPVPTQWAYSGRWEGGRPKSLIYTLSLYASQTHKLPFLSVFFPVGTGFTAALFTSSPSALLRTSFVPVEKEARPGWTNISSAGSLAFLSEGDHLTTTSFKQMHQGKNARAETGQVLEDVVSLTDLPQAPDLQHDCYYPGPRDHGAGGWLLWPAKSLDLRGEDPQCSPFVTLPLIP